MASAFKWRLTDTLFSYITDEHGGEPQITSGYTAEVDAIISKRTVQNFSNEEDYAAQFRIMTDMIAENPETSDVTLLNYSYYYEMDENSCGYLSGGVGVRGVKGDKGDPGDKGRDGKDGRGIADMTFEALENNSGTRVTLIFTDDTQEYFDVMNGQGGSSQPVDYNEILSRVAELGIPEQVISGLESASYENYQAYLDRIYQGALNDIDAVRYGLSDVTDDMGRLHTTVDYVSGQTNTVAQYYRSEKQELVTINQGMSAVSGMAYTNLSRIDVASSGVTRVGKQMSAVSGTITSYAEEINILDEKTCAFTRNISVIEQSARSIKSQVEELCGETRNLSSQYQTASSMTTTLEHQVDGLTTEMSSIFLTYSSLTSTVRDLSNCAVTYSQIEQVATAITANVFSGLTKTGIDIIHENITLNSDNLVCVNDDGEKTMWIDENGNLGTIGNIYPGLAVISGTSTFDKYFLTCSDPEWYYQDDDWLEYDDCIDIMSSSDTSVNPPIPFFWIVDTKGSKSLIEGGTYKLYIPDVFRITDNTVIQVPLSAYTEQYGAVISQILLPYAAPYRYEYNEDKGEHVYTTKIVRTPTTYQSGNWHLITEKELQMLVGRELTFTATDPDMVNGVQFVIPHILYDESYDYWYIDLNSGGTETIEFETNSTVTFRYERLKFRVDGGSVYQNEMFIDGIVPVKQFVAETSSYKDIYLFDSGLT